ncbi:hypothetical protein RhiirC2_718175 [Rhizophagus irregularis]|uniref:RNase H type-1 domain-containing protein n=1 Tax=Rhizophagus irregularis TaxID=588596 RepID=A0A2N1MJG9_9GLOM|nr:hypothetical protein RhiirC2_718175 [Rhizophagus irregularis]
MIEHYQNAAGKKMNDGIAMSDRWQRQYAPKNDINTDWYNATVKEITEEEWMDTIQELAKDKAAGPSKSLSAIVSSQMYMDDVTWLTGSKYTLEKILDITDEFNKMNNIQINYEKFAMTTNEEIQTIDGEIDINFGSEIRKIKPIKAGESVRILGVWVNLDLNTKFVLNQCKNIIRNYNRIIHKKRVTDLQMKYIYNHVIIPRIEYKSQLTIWNHNQIEQLNKLCRSMFKQKTSLVATIPNSVIHSSLGYGVKDIGTIQLQRQVTRLYNQFNTQGVLGIITRIRNKQLQSEMILTKSPTTEWNIKSCDLKVKYNILAATLAIMYDHNLTFRSSGQDENIIRGGSLRITDFFTHNELFKNRMNQQLMKHGIYFISQLISSGGDRLLNYRDLRITLGINTKGRKPSWFKSIEQKCLLEKDSSRRLKSEFHMERNYKCISKDLVPEVKKRNWLAFYHEKNAVAYLGRVIETGVEGTIVEHWIHDIGVDNISPSVQLPIIKKCSGCDLKEIHTKSKRKSVKQRCLLTINDTDRSVKINAKSIDDRYILDMLVFECLAQAENNSITKLVDSITDRTPSNLLTFIHPPSVRNKLLKIKDSLEFVKDIEAYTDGSFKKYSLTSVEMGSAFLISSPKKFEFNVNITDNPSAFKAELIAIILVLLVCPKDANITIYVDAQAIINIFNQLKKESLQQISRGKRQYNAWWILSFKIIKFFNLTVLLVKVKAHDNSEYNNVVDKLAKEALNKDPVFIDPRLLMYKENVCWNHNPIEKEVTIMIKHIRETQWIEEFFNLHRNDCWNNSEMFTEIDWSSTFRVLKGNTELTNFSEHELNSFKVKIQIEELPTLDNLVKRKPHVYSSKWKYPMCLKDKETYTHLWKCEYLGQYRNVKLADLEHQKGINAKMKKSANKSKLVANKLDKILILFKK